MSTGTDESDTVPDNSEQDDDSPSHYFTENLVNLEIIKNNNKGIKKPLTFSDSDFAIGKLNKPFIPNQIPITISPDLILINYAPIKQFPKYIKTTLYAWHDATGESQQAFSATLLKYFRNAFQQIKPTLRFVSLGGSKDIQIDSIERLRNENSNGRIIFHYIGYGFHQLTSDTLYLPGNIPISPKSLFVALTPPALYIFDCDNAGMILPVFQSTAASRPNAQDSQQIYISPEKCNISAFQYLSNTVNYADYFVLCATSPGEELPRDPNLPRDFLTSVLLAPVHTAILCHIYLSYRTSLSYNELSHETVSELELLLDVIVDGIACECLPGPNLHLLFRNDKVIHTLFRNFVLAQFLLRPFGVHPVSHPPLPDMSGHQLWEQWKAAVDNSIGSFASNRGVARDFFDRVLHSFNFLTSHKAYSEIPPSLLSAMIRSGNFKGPAQLISDYPKCIDVLANIIIFSDLFSNLITMPPTDPSFGSLCIIIISIFKFDLNTSYLIPTDFNWIPLLQNLFNREIPLNNRLLISIILTTCTSSHKSLRQLCSTVDFINNLQNELSYAPPILFTWLLLIFKRTYDVFSANPLVFMPSGFHIQCAVSVFHYSHDCRSTAISVLSCFMQGYSAQMNLGLLMYALPNFTDISYLARHQLVMLMLRFLTTHHDEIGPNQEINTADFASFHAMANHFILIPDSKNLPKFYTEIENRKSSFFKAQNINNMMGFFLSYFAYDPHPTIAAEAATARQYFFRTTTKKENEEEEEEEEKGTNDDIPFESDSEALYRILVDQTMNKVLQPEESRARSSFSNFNWSKQPAVSLKVECLLSAQPTAICFDTLSTGVIIAEDNDITFFDDDLKIKSTIHLSSSFTTDVKGGSWFNESLAIVSRANGCGYICKNGNCNPIACWRADPNITGTDTPLYSSIANDKPRIATVRGLNYSVIWDVETLRMIQEMPNEQEANATSIALHPLNSNLIMVGYDNGVATIRDLRDNNLVDTIVVSDEQIPIVKVIGNVAGNSTFYAASENGSVIKWSATSKTDINIMSGTELYDFDAHQILPMLAFSPKCIFDQYIFNENHGGVQKVKMGTESLCVFHPTQPICALASAHEMKIFRL